jgi:hypothetical protein
MENLDWLKECKKEKNISYQEFKDISEHQIEFRKMKALEIIAEELYELTDFFLHKRLI